jgi:hypothetical protein
MIFSPYCKTEILPGFKEDAKNLSTIIFDLEKIDEKIRGTTLLIAEMTSLSNVIENLYFLKNGITNTKKIKS